MGLSNIEVKRMNRNNILRYMLANGSNAKNTIAAALDLSIPTVAQCLKELQEQGLVEEEGTMKSIGGRKAMTFRAIPDAKIAVGVDITRNHANIVVTDLAMNVIHFSRKKIRMYDEAESYAQLHALIDAVIQESGVKMDRILGMGVSLPAIIDENGTKIYAMHEPMQISYHLYEIIKNWFPFPVSLGNDADSAGRAELIDRGVTDNRLFFFVSPSVGGSVFINGETFYGHNRRAGEFGHMTLVPDGKKCYCGRAGCVNSYCSTENLSDLTDGDLGEFFERLKKQDEICLKTWDKYLDYLALAIHNLMTSFDMDMVIGGYLGQYLGDYMDDLKNRVRKFDSYLTGSDFVQPARLKYEASALGAANIFLERYISEV